MNDEKFNRPDVKLRVLVAPLDWGLGHATRCIPLVKALIINGFEVLLAGEGATASLLTTEFPTLVLLPLKGYNIHYGKGRNSLPFVIFSQFNGILRTIRYEHKWLKKVVIEHNIDVVISDNRPGLYHQEVASVYITHQLCIQTGDRFTASIVQKIHYHYINKFSECWVPDAAGNINLAGKLSHPVKMPKVLVKYIGPLSRFEILNRQEKKYDLLVLLSGPEPQRTIFEKKILLQLQSYIGNVLLVRGLPGNEKVQSSDNPIIEQINHLPGPQLNEVIQRSKLVLCRSGYTTVMDLVKLRQAAILIPTPGQTEQEYLGEYLAGKKLFYCARQDAFVLNEVLENAQTFAFHHALIPETFQQVIKEWREKL